MREKTLPEIDDAFAKTYDAESLDKLKEGVRRDLESELTAKQKRDVRQQVIQALMGKVSFELPEGTVANETRNVVYNLVNENARRGVNREVIEKEKDAIYTAAASTARERVKFAFIVQRIAEKEDIKVSQEEIMRRVQVLAQMNQVPVEQFAKDIQKRNGFTEIYDQLAHEKVLEFLENNAKVETVPAAV